MRIGKRGIKREKFLLVLVFTETHLGLQSVYFHFVLGDFPLVQFPFLLFVLLGSIPLLSQLCHLLFFIPDRFFKAAKCTLATAMMCLHRRQSCPGHVDLIVLLFQKVFQILDLQSTTDSIVEWKCWLYRLVDHLVPTRMLIWSFFFFVW